MAKFFLEIGASNFDTLLPLAKAGWHGVVVEPVPYLADQLDEMFAEYPVEIQRVAISDHIGKIEMAVGRDDGDWTVGASHVVSENHLGARLSDYPDNHGNFDETIEVDCITLDRLLYNFDHIDFMKVDAEGHELNIFMNYSFKVKPKFIKVEHKHIDDVLLRQKLMTNGYLVWTEKDDIYGVAF